MVENEQEPTQNPTSFDRRNALKKAAAAGVAAGIVWTAPKIQGLSLRPNYASAMSGVACVFIAYQANPNFFNIQIQNQASELCSYTYTICGASFTEADLATVQGNGATNTMLSTDVNGCLVFTGDIAAFGQVQITQNNGFGGGGGVPFDAGVGTLT